MKIYYNPTIKENGKHQVYLWAWNKDEAVQEVSINDPYEVLFIDEADKASLEAWKVKLKAPVEIIPQGEFQMPEIRQLPVEIEISETDKLSSLRVERNKSLAETDWMMASDTPLTVQEKSDITAYRQALRDITEPIKAKTKTVDEVTLPALPI